MRVFNQVSMFPSGTILLCERCKIDLERLIGKHSQKKSDIKREIYSGQQM